MGLLNSGRYQHHVGPCISITPSSTGIENSYLAVKAREREHKLCTSDTPQNYQSACASTDNTVVVRRFIQWRERDREVCAESRSRDE